MSSPIVPALREHFALQASQTGLITSAFPLGMFFAVFFFPVFSDCKGRKPVLIMSYLGVGVGTVLQALALWRHLPFSVFLALRVASGAFAGASTVVKAYIADTASPELLPKVMAYREAAGTLSFIVGPTLGGLLFRLGGAPAVVFAGGCASLLAAVLVAARLQPTPFSQATQATAVPSPMLSPSPSASSLASSAGGASPSASEFGGLSADGPVEVSSPAVAATMIAVGFAHIFGQSFFNCFFPVFAAERFGWRPAVLGPVMTLLACLVFLTSAVGYPRLVAARDVVSVTTLGLASLSLGLCLFGHAQSILGLCAALCLYGIGIPTFTPGQATILTSAVPRRMRGLVLGLESAVSSAARILAPVVMGKLYQADSATAFYQAGLVVLFGWGLLRLQSGRLRAVLQRAAQLRGVEA